MRALGGPQKLRFMLEYFLEEEPDYPARELLYHTPSTKGWSSPRFCKYPQEIGFKLEHISKIHQIQILSHEFKIASKLEILISESNDQPYSRASFQRLGFLSFDTNERSHHSARELKSANISHTAYYVKIVIHCCHVNKLNIYNQVGILALNLIGEAVSAPIPMPSDGYLQLHAPVTREVTYYNSAAANIADINLDLHVDSVTTQKIRDLARAKDKAVALEQFDEAKSIKAIIERLRVVGQKIAQLEGRKRAAVEREDYDGAMLIKADIDKLRAAGENAAGIVQPPTARPDPEEVFARVLKGSPLTSPTKHRGSSLRGSRESLPPQGVGHTSASYAIPSPVWNAYDELPALGKGRYTPSMDPTGNMGQPPILHLPPLGTGDIRAPSGWPPNLDYPEELPGIVAQESQPLQESCGEYCARSFFSNNWQLREAALHYLVELVRGGSVQERRGAFTTLIRTAQKAMKDKVAAVYLGSTALLLATLGGFPDAGSAQVQSAAESCLPALIEKLGDSNVRISADAKESLMFIANLKEAGLASSTTLLVQPVKNQNAWRPVLGILSVLQDLVPLLGIAKSGTHQGFDLHDLMEFVGKAYSSANADVRSTAVRVTKEVHRLVGNAIRKTLPADINPKIKELVEEAIGGSRPTPAQPAPVFQTPPHHSPPRAARSRAPAARAPPPVAPTPTQQQQQQGHGHSQSQSELKQSQTQQRGGKASAAVANYAQGLPLPVTPPPPAPADDVAAYVDELSRKERQVGKDHPEVAAACSNLAIMYSLKGDTVSAVSMYERALHIYESRYGKKHPEVAHTLTDLAVLHMEEGRDAVGCPMLERALQIQEEALGYDHPDVIAIRDVLGS